MKKLNLNAIKTWEPTFRLGLSDEQLLERGWRSACFGAAKSPNTVFVEVFPSAEHPGFVHYEVWSVTTQQAWTSKEPVLPSHVGDFIAHSLSPLGYDVCKLEWKPSDQAPRDRERATKAAQKEFVYFLTAGPFIKIGKTSGDPSARIRDLQTGCPYRIELAAFLPGGLEQEFSLHRRFAHLRTSGEWFRKEGALAEFVDSLARAKA